MTQFNFGFPKYHLMLLIRDVIRIAIRIVSYMLYRDTYCIASVRTIPTPMSKGGLYRER